MSDKPKNLDDIDNFWDLNSLLPKKRPVSPTHRAPNTDTVEITVGEDSTEKSAGTPIPMQGENARFSVSGGTHVSRHDVTRRINELPLNMRAEQYRSHPLDPYLGRDAHTVVSRVSCMTEFIRCI